MVGELAGELGRAWVLSGITNNRNSERGPRAVFGYSSSPRYPKNSTEIALKIALKSPYNLLLVLLLCCLVIVL